MAEWRNPNLWNNNILSFWAVPIYLIIFCAYFKYPTKCDQMATLFFNPLTFESLKICPLALICKEGTKVCQIPIQNYTKISQRLFKFGPNRRNLAKSGHTGLPNQVYTDVREWFNGHFGCIFIARRGDSLGTSGCCQRDSHDVSSVTGIGEILPLWPNLKSSMQFFKR